MESAKFVRWCDQCNPMRINGVACHELGCPNDGKVRVEGRGWVRFVECWNCGFDVEEGECCDCQDYNTEDDTEEV
jgi:hypothetical protein